jgi:hypothetical protein
MRRFSGTLVLLVGLVSGLPLAQAQELSIRERVYVNTLAQELGLTVRRSEAVTQDDGGRGLRVTFADGTTVTRLRYPDPGGALDYAGHYPGDGGTADPPVLVQVRDRQALLIQSPNVSDPVVGRHYLDAGWSYLRGGAKPTSMTGYLEGNDVVGTTGPTGAFYDSITGAVDAAKRNRDRPAAGVSDLGRGLYRWDASRSDMVSVFQQDAKSGSFVLAGDAERARQLVERLAALSGQPQPDLQRGLETPPSTTAQRPRDEAPKPTASPRKPTAQQPKAPKPEAKKPATQTPYEGAGKTLDGLFD